MIRCRRPKRRLEEEIVSPFDLLPRAGNPRYELAHQAFRVGARRNRRDVQRTFGGGDLPGYPAGQHVVRFVVTASLTVVVA
jgi:hypothetical protein